MQQKFMEIIMNKDEKELEINMSQKIAYQYISYWFIGY